MKYNVQLFKDSLDISANILIYFLIFDSGQRSSLISNDKPADRFDDKSDIFRGQDNPGSCERKLM